jgi:integrase
VTQGRRANHEGTVYKSAAGSWKAEVTVSVNGRTKRIRATGKTRAEAVALRRQREMEWRTKASAFGSVPTDVTLREYLGAWLAGLQVRVSTKKARKGHVERIIAAIGQRRLCEVTPADVRFLLDRLQRDKVGTRQQQMTYETLRAALNEAVREDLIASNPVLRVRRPKHQRVEYPALDAAGANRLIAAADTCEERTLYAVAVETGLRQGELLALTWDDVDLGAGRVHVRATLTRGDDGRLVRTPPKTEKSLRSVPLATRSRALLAELRGENKEPGFVFKMRDKGGVLRRFYATRKRAGLPQVRFHSLRVTSNSLLIEHGADPVEIAARMGHTSTRMTLDVYARLFNDRQGRLAALMDRAFEQLPPTTASAVPVVEHRGALKSKEPRRSTVLFAMETSGFEPLTSCLQSRRSTN